MRHLCRRAMQVMIELALQMLIDYAPHTMEVAKHAKRCRSGRYLSSLSVVILGDGHSRIELMVCSAYVGKLDTSWYLPIPFGF